MVCLILLLYVILLMVCLVLILCVVFLLDCLTLRKCSLPSQASAADFLFILFLGFFIVARGDRFI